MSDQGPASPISPGRSWYEMSCGPRPGYAALDRDTRCDVAIVGGGFCGLSAALHLARRGVDVVLIDAHRFGDGASGRNGGQMGTGPRASVADLEKEIGFERSKALWDMAEDAKRSLLDIAKEEDFETDYRPGQLTPMHRQRFEADARGEMEHIAGHYGYDELSWLDREDMAAALGSQHYFGGLKDRGTGHIHPMKYLIGLANAAKRAGAKLHEHTKAVAISTGRQISIKTASGAITADRCLLALNGYHGDLRPELARHVLPIQSFIGATAPLPDDTPVLPGGEAVDDSRFVVRYFRKTPDNRLLFGGREAYGKATPGDIERTIRRQIEETYPGLAGVEITHAWGGNVAITMPRNPYVRALEPGLWTAGGFSGHGVMLSNYTGRLIAEKFVGLNNAVDALADLRIPAFPGGAMLRNPLKILALTWYAMLDRI